MKLITNLIGKKFNYLTIVEDLGIISNKRYCMAICECGKLRKHEINSLKTGGTKSCGCLRTKSNLTGDNGRKHGLRNHPLYQTWIGMKDRCYCTSDPAYPNYGGSGVKVCDEWVNNFPLFYDWALKNGWRKDLHIDKDKLSPYKTGKMYSPEFCCFLTRKENMRYRRNSIIIEYNNEFKCLSEWCELLELNYHLIFDRLSNNWPVNKAFRTPLYKNHSHKKFKVS